MLQEMDDVVNLHASGDDDSDSEPDNVVNVANRNNSPLLVAMSDPNATFGNASGDACGRCGDFECMLPHGESCGAPITKFIVCIKCQCLCATLSVYLAHVATCLRLPESRAPHYADHIVQFEEPPQLSVCDCCGIYRQRQGALLDTHRHICLRYASEHDGQRFPFLPGEITWTYENSVFSPPRFFQRLLRQLAQGQRWSEVETCYLAQSGQNEMWAQLRSGAFRSLSGRAPVFPGATMYTAPLRTVSADLNTSSATSCSTSTTVTTSEAGRSSTHEEPTAAAAAALVQLSASAETPMQVAETSAGDRVAHVAPQRTASQPTRGRRRRGRRGGSWVHDQQRRSSTPTGVAARRLETAAGPSSSTARRAERRSLPQPEHQSPILRQPRTRDDAATGTGRSQRQRHNAARDNAGDAAARPLRVVNEIDGNLQVTSPRNDSGVDRGASGDPPAATRSRSDSSRGRHKYLEGAVLDHRSGNFIAAVLVSGVPAVGVNAVLRRYELARHAAVGVSSGLQVSYYGRPSEYTHLSDRALAQARGQALLVHSDTKMPAGTFWFWELPPVSGEWLLPVRDDARPNTGAEHIRLRFSALRRA